MGNKFEISDDGSIFFIDNDGTINRLGKIDSQGKIEGEGTDKSVGALWFFLFAATIIAIVLGVKLSDASGNLSYYKQEYNSLTNKQSNITSENDRLKSDNDNLKNQNGNLNREISNLQGQIPVQYQVISNADYYYKDRCGNNGYARANCYSQPGSIVKIYKIENGYGLTDYGWVYMHNLRKQ